MNAARSPLVAGFRFVRLNLPVRASDGASSFTCCNANPTLQGVGNAEGFKIMAEGRPVPSINNVQ